MEMIVDEELSKSKNKWRFIIDNAEAIKESGAKVVLHNENTNVSIRDKNDCDEGFLQLVTIGTNDGCVKLASIADHPGAYRLLDASEE